MNLAKERKSVYVALDKYRAWLDTIPDEQFTETPKGGGWSFAEVYSHIMQATLGSIIALERCTSNNCEPTTNRTNFFWKIRDVIRSVPHEGQSTGKSGRADACG